MNIMYRLNEENDAILIKQELYEQINLTHSIIKTLYPELLEPINEKKQRDFLVLFEKQMQEVDAQHLQFSTISANVPIAFISEQGGLNSSPQVKLTDSIYMLNSMAHLLYQILDDEIEEHLLNVLSTVKKCTQKIVNLIEEVNVKLVFNK